MTYVSVNTHQGKGTKTKDTPSSDKGYSHLSPGSSTINLTDFSELHDDVRMIYSAQTYKDPDNESANTPDIEREDLDELLNNLRHLFINRVQKMHAELSDAQRLRSSNFRTHAEYSIENSKGDQILIAKHVEVPGYYDQGRLTISYDVYNRFGHLLFTTDGRDTKCGMSALIKGEGEAVRGQVLSSGLFCYKIQDSVTGHTYHVRLPCWVVVFTCFLFCFLPTIRIFRQANPALKAKKKLVATFGNQKCQRNFYGKTVQFGLRFEDRMEPDTKLFLFSSVLILFHLYFKRTGKEVRCLIYYFILSVLLGLIGMIGLFLYNRSFSHPK